MKKKLLSAFIAFGIFVSAFGAFYLHKSNYFTGNDQSAKNNFKETSESSEKPDPDSPDEAHQWRALAWKDENGQIPPNALSEAVRQRDDYLQQLAAPDGFSDAGVARLNWVSRGPQNVGGRTRSIIIHPYDSNIMWAGSVSGGVWKSTDAGQNWYAMNNSLQNYAVSSMAIDPNNPNVLYAGTGEGFFNSDGLQGDGMFKTTDGGMTWNRVNGTRPQYPDYYHWSRIDRISIAHDDSNKILVATGTRLMRTTNGGTTWQPAVEGKSLYVAFDPSNSSKAIAEVNQNDVHKVLYSINGGETWIPAMRDGGPFQLNGWLERIELAYSRSSPNIVYALFPSATGGTIARSIDGGQNFSTKATQSDASISASWYNNTLWVSPTDPNLIVAGGTHLHRSTNGGDNFTRISNGYIMSVQPHVDHHCIVSDPGYNGNSNKRVYVCNDGGVYRTNDITTANTGSGWERKELNYRTTQYYGAAGNGTTGLIYGGTQDNGTLRLLPGTQDANLPYGGDGGFSAVDPTNDTYCYGEEFGLRIHRSINRGVSAQKIYFGITDISDTGGPNYTNFIAPFILDQNQPNRMLAGGASLWRTDNVRGNGDPNNQPSWFKIRNNPTNRRISAIAVAPGNSDIVWVAEDVIDATLNIRQGRVYKTTNGTASNPSWQIVDDNVNNNPLPNRFVTRILIDKGDSNVVYVALGGFKEDNLWRTTNGGASWQEITGGIACQSTASVGLPCAPIRGMARHPNNPNKLYAGTEIGVYTSENGGSSWSAVLDGPANVSVDELTFMSNSTVLLAATHGRGIWTANVEITTSANRVPHDFDGDGRTDISVYRPSNGTWYLQRSTAGFRAQQWGNSTDKAVAADYDGDGKADITVWRASVGDWYRLNSSNGLFVSVHFGQNNDIPVPADYDGDGKADEAVFRPSAGAWYLNQSTNGFAAYQWGIQSDIPVTGDFDGDGKADLGVFRMVNGLWCLITSSLGVQYVSWGQNGDVPVAADYDGDGKADPAVFRASNGYGNWYLQRSSAGFFGTQWGLSTDKPVPGDYDGDGKADIAVWRPSDGTWYLLQSSNGYRDEHFGANQDIPIPIR